jgi:hypothetical protein
MTTSSGSAAASAALAGYAPGYQPEPYQRHPLGLPAGSVRALLALMVFGLIWALWLLPEDKVQPVPLYLYSLMFLILGSYFAARSSGGTTPAAGSRHPLFLPRGTFRTLFLLGFAAALGWGFYSDPNFQARLKPAIPEQPLQPLILLVAFFVGIVVSRFGRRFLSGPTGAPPWFQDLLAWVSLLAMLGLGFEVIILLVINPTMDPSRQLDLPHWEGFLSAVIGFYFGARS